MARKVTNFEIYVNQGAVEVLPRITVTEEGEKVIAVWIGGSNDDYEGSSSGFTEGSSRMRIEILDKEKQLSGEKITFE